MARKKVTSVPALADWGAVDNALRDIRECQHTPVSYTHLTLPTT